MSRVLAFGIDLPGLQAGTFAGCYWFSHGRPIVRLAPGRTFDRQDRTLSDADAPAPHGASACPHRSMTERCYWEARGFVLWPCRYFVALKRKSAPWTK
jgi:hypothetical protein